MLPILTHQEVLKMLENGFSDENHGEDLLGLPVTEIDLKIEEYENTLCRGYICR